MGFQIFFSGLYSPHFTHGLVILVQVNYLINAATMGHSCLLLGPTMTGARPDQNQERGTTFRSLPRVSRIQLLESPSAVSQGPRYSQELRPGMNPGAQCETVHQVRDQTSTSLVQRFNVKRISFMTNFS